MKRGNWMDEYRTHPLYASMSRRRALGLAGTAAALIGCSSSGSKTPSSGGTKSGANVATAAPTDSKPKTGGIIKYPVPKDPDSLDPYRLAFGAGGTWAAANVYS